MRVGEKPNFNRPNESIRQKSDFFVIFKSCVNVRFFTSFKRAKKNVFFKKGDSQNRVFVLFCAWSSKKDVGWPRNEEISVFFTFLTNSGNSGILGFPDPQIRDSESQNLTFELNFTQIYYFTPHFNKIKLVFTAKSGEPIWSPFSQNGIKCRKMHILITVETIGPKIRLLELLFGPKTIKLYITL